MAQPERVYVAVDVSNLWHACRKQFGDTARLDFLALSKMVQALRHPAQIRQQLVAYTITHSRTRPGAFVNTLKTYGYEVRERHMSYTKVTKTLFKPFRTDWDVGITIDAIHAMSSYDTFCLMSGDADFDQLIDYLRYQGKHTLVLSFEDVFGRRLYNHADDVVMLDRSVVFERAGVT